jgi:hypothetical protein
MLMTYIHEQTNSQKKFARQGALKKTLLLPSLFRFCSQRESTGQGIEDFRVPERPSIINRHSLEAPLVSIPHQVAIVAIHQ